MIANRILKKILIYFVIVPIALILTISFLGFLQAAHPQKIDSNLHPSDLNWEHESVEITTSDGLKLAGWYVPADIETDKAIILLHGYPAEKSNLLGWASFLKPEYNLLFFDFRYFGESEGDFSSLGYYERQDVIAAIKKTRDLGNEQIVLMGFSFGGATALAAIPQIRDEITGIIADSAFANLDIMGKSYYGSIGFVEPVMMSLTKFWANLIYGIDINDVSAEKAVRDTNLPILIIHSSQDQVVTLENAEVLQEALGENPNARFLIYDRGIHGELLGREIYESAIVDFLNENLE